MHDNPHTAPMHEFHLPGYGVLALRGRDSVSFAQSQFMNDVTALADGQWQWNGWLNAKGRVIALFALLRLAPDTLWLLLPDADAATLSAQLQRYVFRSKVALEVLPQRIHGCFGPPGHAGGATLAVLADGTVELDMTANGGPRTLTIGGSCCSDDADAVARWQACDLRHGLPHLPAPQVERWTPQQLSLQHLHAFSVKKGCYPGQEIVARTHFLGQAKRGLTLLEGEATLAAGLAVCADGQALGEVVSAMGAWGLAVLPTECTDRALRAGDTPVRAHSLADGLAR